MDTLTKSEQHISKLLSLVLRHRPEVLGVELDAHGWAPIADILAGMNRQGTYCDRKILDRVVALNNKKRFMVSEDGTKIRACQGHTVHVDVEMEETEPPAVLYHGTVEKNCLSIAKEGLLPMQRLYVHLSPDIETARQVGSRRRGLVVIYKVDCAAMRHDGYVFYRAHNGVWQTKCVPAKYLEKL